MQISGKYQFTGPATEAGGFVTYIALDPSEGRSVEIRTCPTGAQSGEQAQALQSEARNLARLEHPNIVRFVECEQDEEGTIYLVVEPGEGQSLSAFLDSSASLNSEKALAWIEQTATALDYVHSKGIVHRNLTPRSILIEEAGTVKLGGFELSRASEDTSEDLPASDAVRQSLAYQPPEMLLGDESGSYSDQFSLAVVAVQCLTGERPFGADKAVAGMFEIVFSPARLDMLEGRYPAAVVRVLERALSKSGARRFPTCAEFAKALGTALSGKASSETRALSSAQLSDELAKVSGARSGRSTDSSRRAAAPVRRPYALWAGVGVFALLAIAAVAYWSSLPTQTVAPVAPAVVADPFKDAVKSIVTNPGSTEKNKTSPKPRPPAAKVQKDPPAPAQVQPVELSVPPPTESPRKQPKFAEPVIGLK